MRLPGKPRKNKPEPSPDDTQEMFTAGQELPDDPEEPLEPEPIDDEEVIEETDLEETEDEDWDEEAYEEWDETGDPEDEVEEATEEEPDADPTPLEDLKVWFGEFRERAKAVAAKFRARAAVWLKRAGEIRIPRHEIDGQKVLLGAGILAVSLMVGSAGYLLGKGTGDDLDTARLEGEFAGKRDGAIEGATRGYAAGFKKGRDLAFRKSYSASYRRNYQRAYEAAGMDPPRAKDIEVPRP